MPNIIDADGLRIKEIQAIVADLNSKLKAIYGDDTNLSPETPDAELVTIFSQAVRDLEEYLLDINAGFDPDQAAGRILDQRVAINGIQRQGGTYSITPVDLTADRAVQLFGDDWTGPDQKYIVEDDAGTKWFLRNTASLIAGLTTLSFRSELPGAVLSQVGTIRTPVTIINGITNVNNSQPQTTIGDNEESDVALKERRRSSVSLSSQGYRPALLAALKNIPGMIDAYVYENRTSAIDGRGLPPHSIWVITDGTATDVNISTAIYRKRNAGSDLKEGAKVYNLPEIDGEIFRATWDEVAVTTAFVKFTVLPLNPAFPVSIDVIKQRLPSVFRPGVGGQVNINDLATAVKSIDANALVLDAGFSENLAGPYTPVLAPEMNERFGFISSNIIITPMEIIPRINSVQAGVEVQFSVNGGYGPYVWSVESGSGSIDSTGKFTGGSIGTSVIKAVDSLLNEAIKTVQVVS